MTVEQTLARVRADLDAGRNALARQRLRGLVGSFPERLELREQLAALYRAEGNLAQAGRWSYLSAQPDPREIQAFERAYRDGWQQMRALGWRSSEDIEDGVVSRRLRALREGAEAQVGTKLSWERSGERVEPPKTLKVRLAEFGCGLLAVVLITLLVIGTVSLLAQGAGVVVGWLD